MIGDFFLQKSGVCYNLQSDPNNPVWCTTICMTDTEFEQFERFCENRGIRPHGQIRKDLKKIPLDKAKDLMDTLAIEVRADLAEILNQEPA